MMKKIDLQNKTTPKVGKIEIYWFENERIGLKKTLFHRIIIPLEPFDSGLEYVEQPENTEIVFEWYDLSLKNPKELDGLDLSSKNYPKAEASVYVGSAHNWCDVKMLKLSKINSNTFKVKGKIMINFETEGVGKNESYNFETKAELN